MTRPAGIRSAFAAQSPLTVELDARPVYDFLVSIGTEDTSELLPEDARWVEATRALLPADLRPGSSSVASHCLGFAGELARLLVGRPEIRTARQFVEFVAPMTDRQIVEVALGELLETPELATLTRRAIDGHEAARSELRAQLSTEHPVDNFDFDLDAMAPAMRRGMDIWLEPFEQIEERVARMQQRDLSMRRAEQGTMPGLGLVEWATNGIRLVPDQRTRRIVLSPSYFFRPYNFVTRVGDTQLICYPVADEALDAADRVAPPAATVRLYRALGDESRLKILRLLSERDWYLTELANELELSKPTIKHHLAQLRSAGLVTMTDEGNLTYYSLRGDRVQAAGSELSAFLSR